MPMSCVYGIIAHHIPIPLDPFPFRLRYDQVLHANDVVMLVVNAQSNPQVLTELLNQSPVIVQVSASRLVYVQAVRLRHDSLLEVPAQCVALNRGGCPQ